MQSGISVRSADIRRRAAVIGLLVVFVLLLSSGIAAAGYPRSMAATGDSITRAFNTAWFPFVDNPEGSWSTGSDEVVGSHYERLVRLEPALEGQNHNDARSGARMVDLAGQMRTAVQQGAEYVTVLIGGNDLCRPTVEAMTSVDAFRGQFAAALDIVTTALPKARILVASIPDVEQLWELLHDNASARRVWADFHICQSLLADPLSDAPRDVARRETVRQRNLAFNAVLAEVCATHTQCRFDGNAVFEATFTLPDVSTRDWFHPSVTGQAKLAATTWAAGYWP